MFFAKKQSIKQDLILNAFKSKQYILKAQTLKFPAVLNDPSKAPRSTAKWRDKRGLSEERSDEFRSAAI
ncbi:MAG: hypothetical protein AB7U63_11545 [Porticoccaceae bacterium]